ncbi:MAG TPA: inorganic diphosphatase [Candidatus Megaira endosymbiont of Hartmannula sinica]|nr:inorganic diphosphatase [Candidatus Megaera endosymbiont of Hartmannula sinica]
MLINKIRPQDNKGNYNVIIEIPMGDDPVKYEFDKEYNIMKVDRFMPVSMSYPCNYGFIPSTMSEDKDPIDVLVIANYPIKSGVMINVKVIGVLEMEDESGIDEKIIAVPSLKLDPNFKNINNIKDLDNLYPMMSKKISHFFENYKKLEENKWVKITGFNTNDKAIEMINTSISRFNNQ